MPDTDSITLVKKMQYRGADEEWSNTYHLSGTTPTDDAGWKALAVAIFATEKACYKSTSTLVRAYGYVAGNDHSVSQIDFSVGTPLLPAGTLVVGGSDGRLAGDQATWVRALVGTSSTGKKVYVRKYFHDGTCIVTSPDNVSPTLITNLNAHAAAMLGGTLPGSMVWVGPQGATATLPKASQFVTTRTLKRRGKRP